MPIACLWFVASAGNGSGLDINPLAATSACPLYKGDITKNKESHAKNQLHSNILHTVLQLFHGISKVLRLRLKGLLHNGVNMSVCV